MTGALDPGTITPLLFMGGILLCLLLIILSTAYRFSKLRQGIVADGMISEKEVERDEGTFYYVTYRFPDYANRVRIKKVEVTKRHFDLLSVGQRISVIYNLDKPDNSFINDGELRSSFFKGFNILVGAAIILAVCGYGLYASFR